MRSLPIPSEFIRNRVALTWREALWGLEHQLLDRLTIVDVAIDRLIEGSDNPIEVELAAMQKSAIHEAGDLLRQLAETEPALSEAEIARKWLFLRMAWIYDDKKSAGDRLAEAESAYADFGYPREVEGFIRYMPANWNYDPKVHTLEENEARLFRMWKQYLDAGAREFVKPGAGM